MSTRTFCACLPVWLLAMLCPGYVTGIIGLGLVMFVAKDVFLVVVNIFASLYASYVFCAAIFEICYSPRDEFPASFYWVFPLCAIVASLFLKSQFGERTPNYNFGNTNSGSFRNTKYGSFAGVSFLCEDDIWSRLRNGGKSTPRDENSSRNSHDRRCTPRDENRSHSSHHNSPARNKDRHGYYKVLGVPCTASAADIKKAYQMLSLKYHPDRKVDSEKAEANNMMALINQANDVLSDVSKRQEYDMSG